ncbi:hypothetical protein SEA_REDWATTLEHOG_205 [Gordonia phage RedWattleHog]|uniref:Uncharacterized protein n=1 Tax=Gordonia phage Stormageddon TaxID=2656541 RepID=A0A649VRG3_9CAUD|nr:hypothetical protein KHQ86_gp094 [Gordonia phage Stormageddon]QGJ95066.1 hypothetical protein SEA_STORMAGEDDON_206 [Gordonia phage Stormageddon]QLF83708.1 hypothetical protein SEA_REDWATTLEHOG_205 [Gordonia phage RedWattleHog]
MSDTTARVMNTTDVLNAAEVIEAAIQGKSVALIDVLGNVSYGTARSIGDEQGYFARGDEDVRDCYLRITMRSGVERFEKVSDLMNGLRTTFFPGAHE